MANVEQSNSKSPDDRTVYLAQYDNWSGSVQLKEFGSQPITMIGEVLVTGRMDQEEQFRLENVQRVAMRSHEKVKALGGAIAISGPVNNTQEDNKRFEGLIYYPRLSTELKPACTESDATYPHFEVASGSLILDPVGTSTDFNVLFNLDQIQEPHLSILEGFQLDVLPLSFRPPSDQPYMPSKANSLTACVAALPTGNHKVKELKIRVWAEDTIIVNQTLKTQVQGWIDKACEVWYQKGGISILPFGQINSRPQADIPTISGKNADMGDQDFIDIYLVDSILPQQSNGGLTFDCGTPDACVLLDVVRISSDNDYILAHEIGHILGLYHPDDCNPCARRRRGSRNSVMVPVSPILAHNTLNNLEASLGLENVLTPPIFTTTDSMCQWSPDTNIPDLVIQDLWNSPLDLRINFSDTDDSRQQYSDGTEVFGPSNLPTHSHPQNVDDTNFMCIRLSDCRRPRPVRIFFYLGSNQTPDTLRLLPVVSHNSGPQLIFPANQNEEIRASWFNSRKRTRSVPWTVPNGPSDSWIFAIEVSASDVPQNILDDIRNFVQVQDALPGTDNAATLMTQHPNVIGRRITLPEAV